MLQIGKGELVTVVGWMEGEGSKLASRVSGPVSHSGHFVQLIAPKVNLGGRYRAPMSTMLEAIHIANSRLPPDNAVYRGSLVD